MMQRKLSKSMIEEMNYTDFISLIRETNRCPGGKDSIRKILLNSFVTTTSNVLEVGSNTGFTSLEVARTIKCKTEGIDISKACVEESQRLLSEDTKEIQKLVNFQVASAYDIPFPDNTFDLVITGGATSFINKKQKAISEYVRVVKPWGYISATQLFYVTQPPDDVIKNVSNAINVEIIPWMEKDWLDLFYNNKTQLELYYYEKNTLSERTPDILDEYIEYFIQKEHLSGYSPEIQDAIRIKWKWYLDIFNENHKYLGYFIALFRRRVLPEEPELFIRKNP